MIIGLDWIVVPLSEQPPEQGAKHSFVCLMTATTTKIVTYLPALDKGNQRVIIRLSHYFLNGGALMEEALVLNALSVIPVLFAFQFLLPLAWKLIRHSLRVARICINIS